MWVPHVSFFRDVGGYDASAASPTCNNGDGRRVETSGNRMYWYDNSGEVMEESDDHGTLQKVYFYLNGAKLAYLQGPSSLYFYYRDHLGTTRMMTDGSGNVCYDADYFPWGDEDHVFTSTCSQNYKFTAKERDPDLGVYNMGARFYQDAMARFYSPDPIGIMKQKLFDPQQWNMYAYARNNPLRFTDPTGKYVCNGNKTQCGQIKAGYDAAKTALQNANPKSQQAKQLKSVLGFLGEPGKANGVVVKFDKLDVGTLGQTHTETTTDLLGTHHTTTTITFDLGQVDSAVKLNSGHPLEPLDNDVGGTLVHEGTHGRDDLAQGHDPESKAEALTTERNAYRNEGYVYDLLGVPSYINPALTAPGADRDAAVEQSANASVEAEGW